MRFVDVPNLHGALGVSHRWFKHPLFQRSNGRLSSSLLLYQPYGPAWLEPKGPAVEARLHPVLWVDGSGCLWQMFRSRPDRIVLDTNQIRLAACTTLRCKKATCQHKFRKRCRQCASTVHKPKWMRIYRCGESNSRSLCCRSHRG